MQHENTSRWKIIEDITFVQEKFPLKNRIVPSLDAGDDSNIYRSERCGGWI